MPEKATSYGKVNWLLSILAASLLIVPITSTPAPNNRHGNKHSNCHRVRPGQSIQKAINDARPGDRIEVLAGTYAEQLEITTSDLTLIGHSATLVPPPTPQPNFCTGLSKTLDGQDAESGICIHGASISLTPFVAEHRKVLSVGRPIANIRIKNLTVSSFSGANIALVGASNARIKHNTLIAGGTYGFLTAGSTGTVASHNTISSPQITGPTIAMCMDDTTPAVFAHNDITAHLVALCGQTSHGVMRANRVRDCCLGAVVDPGVRGLRVSQNRIADRAAACDGFPGAPGAGVLLLGAVEAVVSGNRISGIRTANRKGVGLFLTDQAGVVAEGNVVQENKFQGNDFNVVDISTGRNVLEGN
jgi:nitrous oxidase accessory protein NosD